MTTKMSGYAFILGVFLATFFGGYPHILTTGSGKPAVKSNCKKHFKKHFGLAQGIPKGTRDKERKKEQLDLPVGSTGAG